MIKKLRRKFIFVNMMLVTLVLLIVFGALIYTNYHRTKTSGYDMLNRLLTSPQQDEFQKPLVGKPPQGQTPSSPQNMLFFTVETDKSGHITHIFSDNVTVENDTVQSAVKFALDSNQNNGNLSNLSLKYAKRVTSDGYKLAFMDTQNELNSFKNLVFTSLAVGICGLIAFFIISLFLSAWALRPVEKSWQQQKQFVADASHELKTPLTVILANTEILLSHKQSTVEQEKQWIESTKQEGTRMKKLIGDMLYLAKSDDMQTKKIVSDFSLSDVVLGTALQFEAVAFENGISIDIVDVQEDLHITGDKNDIKKLCGILLDNACKYAGKQGVVKVALNRADNHTVLSVNNTGNVIENEDKEHIFERFYRTDKSRAQSSGGYGLGLSIAKSISDSHKATISVTSNAHDGTTFFVTF